MARRSKGHLKRDVTRTVVTRRLAASVRRLRQEKGWTMKVTAERIGVVPITLRRIENGVGNPSLAILLRIAHVFRVSLSELFSPARR